MRRCLRCGRPSSAVCWNRSPRRPRAGQRRAEILAATAPTSGPLASTFRMLSEDSTESTDSTDNTEPNDNAEAIDPNEATELIDRIEPDDPIDRMDPVEPMDRIEPDDPIDRIEPEEPMERMESAGRWAFTPFREVVPISAVGLCLFI